MTRESILASGVSSEPPIHTQATARPWETDNTAVRSEGPGGRQVALCGFSARGGQRYDDAYDEAVANAALIVKAVNRDHHFDEMKAALEAHQLWDKREKEGPLYPFGVTRDCPEGEKIWKAWWHDQMNLCDEATSRTDAVLAALAGAK